VPCPAESSPRLDYAPASRTRFRRTKRVVIGILICTAIYPCVLKGPGFVKRAHLLYYQHQCLTYTAPADEIVYDSHSKAATALLAHSVNYVADPLNANAVLRKKPACLEQLDQRLAPPPRGGIGCSAITFLHERRSRNGATRLVIVTDLPRGLFGSAEARAPTGLRGPLIYPSAQLQWAPVPRTMDVGDPDGVRIAGKSLPLRIYAGQPDPTDESHFTISYEINHQKDILDGYLKDDSSIEFSYRGGASTRPIVFGTGTIRLQDTDPSTFFLRPHGDLIDDRPIRRP
jgi:hypothetical protein